MVQLFVLASALLVSTAHALCPSGQTDMSVETVNGIFCVNATRICSGSVYDGDCPSAQEGLPDGSYCGVVASGVYGCKPNGDANAPTTTVTPTLTPTSTPLPAWVMLTGSQCAAADRKWLIMGSEDVLCLQPTGRACTGTYVSGMICPGPQLRLPYGSSCRFIGESNNVGCYANSEFGPAGGYEPVEIPDECKYGLRVSGRGGHYCVKEGTRCQSTEGLCPHPQQGLPYGSYCQQVEWGYYECLPYDAPTPTPSAATPAPATPAPATSVPTTPVPVTTATAAPGTLPDCGEGNSPMSVEGVVPIYCVAEPACVADYATGNCPGPQRGLPFGSACGIIQKTGVYGCKPLSQ